MSSEPNWHSIYRSKISRFLEKKMTQGEPMMEIAVQTAIGIRIPDVVWDKPAFWMSQENESACISAPMLCVEVVSESSSQEEMSVKINAYTAAGAKEVWLVYKNKTTDFYNNGKLQDSSSFGVTSAHIKAAL